MSQRISPPPTCCECAQRCCSLPRLPVRLWPMPPRKTLLPSALTALHTFVWNAKVYHSAIPMLKSHRAVALHDLPPGRGGAKSSGGAASVPTPVSTKPPAQSAAQKKSAVASAAGPPAASAAASASVAAASSDAAAQALSSLVASFAAPVMCEKHISEKIDYFCISCYDAACAKCVITDHRGEDHEVGASDTASDAVRGCVAEDVANMLVHKKEMEAVLASVHNRMAGVRTAQAAALQTLNARFDALADAVAARRAELAAEVATHCKARLKALEAQAYSIDVLLGHAEMATAGGDRLLNFCSTAQIFAGAADVNERFRALLNEKAQEPTAPVVETALVFTGALDDAIQRIKCFDPLRVTDLGLTHVRIEDAHSAAAIRLAGQTISVPLTTTPPTAETLDRGAFLDILARRMRVSDASGHPDVVCEFAVETDTKQSKQLVLRITWRRAADGVRNKTLSLSLIAPNGQSLDKQVELVLHEPKVEFSPLLYSPRGNVNIAAPFRRVKGDYNTYCYNSAYMYGQEEMKEGVWTWYFKIYEGYNTVNVGCAWTPLQHTTADRFAGISQWSGYSQRFFMSSNGYSNTSTQCAQLIKKNGIVVGFELNLKTGKMQVRAEPGEAAAAAEAAAAPDSCIEFDTGLAGKTVVVYAAFQGQFDVELLDLKRIG
jgi:hypothetical protein